MASRRKGHRSKAVIKLATEMYSGTICLYVERNLCRITGQQCSINSCYKSTFYERRRVCATQQKYMLQRSYICIYFRTSVSRTCTLVSFFTNDPCVSYLKILPAFIIRLGPLLSDECDLESNSVITSCK